LTLFAVAGAMSLVMGRELSAAARAARGSLIAQAGGWTTIVAAEFVWDMPLSVMAITCGSVANLLMFKALEGWLGRRPGKRILYALCILMPLGYAISYDSYPVRVGWSNILLAMQFSIVAVAVLWTSPKTDEKGWRVLLALCYAPMAVLTLGRGILGAWFTELYPTFVTPHPINVAAQATANMSLVLSTVAVLVAWRREVEMQLEHQAHTDPLTGLLNRRGWTQYADKMVAQARRHRFGVAVLMIDIDHFKQVNDRFGHEAGDRALVLLGQCMQSTMRESDVCGRLGGEEFALLLAHLDEPAAVALDQRLRHLFQTTTGQQLGITLNFSSGLAFCEFSQADALKKALMRADAGMYQAKASGRGRLCANADVNVTVPDQLLH
ncbi:MAG: GGDEF domain-containing protein, partial [Burkholderiaceae bacterium]